MPVLPFVLAGAVGWGAVACYRDLAKGRAASSRQPLDHDSLPSAAESLGYIEPGDAVKSAAHAVGEGIHTAEAGFGAAIEQIGHFFHH